MPKSVSPSTPARKRAETASKRTVRNLRKSEEQRRKAIALLNHWSDAHVPVELIAGSSGLRIMGYLVKLQMNPAGDDFMFKTPFGVAATVFTMIYDEVEVDELLPDAPAVVLSMSKFPEVRFRLRGTSQLCCINPTGKDGGGFIRRMDRRKRQAARHHRRRSAGFRLHL